MIRRTDSIDTSCEVWSSGTSPGKTSSGDLDLPENIYGHGKRLEWTVSHLADSDRVLEMGCRTGHMITLPLLHLASDAVGVETDAASIEYGQPGPSEEGFDSSQPRATERWAGAKS